MNIVQHTLAQMTLNKAQQKFLSLLLSTLLIIRGKVNFTSLSRHCDMSERTICRNYHKPFDFTLFNQQLLKNASCFQDDTLFVIDASFLPKSGKHTYGLDWFWNGSQGKAEKGL